MRSGCTQYLMGANVGVCAWPRAGSWAAVISSVSRAHLTELGFLFQHPHLKFPARPYYRQAPSVFRGFEMSVL